LLFSRQIWWRSQSFVISFCSENIYGYSVFCIFCRKLIRFVSSFNLVFFMSWRIMYKRNYFIKKQNVKVLHSSYILCAFFSFKLLHSYYIKNLRKRRKKRIFFSFLWRISDY
jgi:hypothetical protein